MKRIEAAEESLSRANWLYFMAWSFVLVVGIAAFIQILAISREQGQLESRRVALEKLGSGALEIAANLRRELVVQYYSSLSEGESLRQLISDSIFFRRSLSSARSKIATIPLPERDLPLARLITENYVLTFFNQEVNVSPPISREPALLLAEDSLGYIRPAPLVEQLTLEDLVKCLWLSTLRPKAWNIVEEYDPSVSVSAAEEAGSPRIASVLSANLSDPLMRMYRGGAGELWIAWINLFRGAEGEADRQKTLDMTLERLREEHAETLDRLVEIMMLKEGSSEVALPLVETRVSLRDAIVALPIILAIATVGVGIYIWQAIRHITLAQHNNESEIVGGAPIFVWQHGMKVVGEIILLGPYLGFGLIILLGPEIIRADKPEELIIFWIYVLISVALAIPALVQNWRLQKQLNLYGSALGPNRTGSTPTSPAPCG